MNKKSNPQSRLFYVDNLRIFLISLVVLHHLAITYGAPGSWYYNEVEADLISSIPFSMFVATNQAFFMGMFFLISAFFMWPSLKRKGTLVFVKDRLLRLGIPLAGFYLLMSPLSVYLLVRFVDGMDISFWSFISAGRGRGFGPMWFVEALLLFSLIYVALFAMKKKRKQEIEKIRPFPSIHRIILFALSISFGTFIIRIWLPVGWAMGFTGFQFPHFLQYISLFIIGIVSYKNNWLNSIDYKKGLRWFVFVQVMIFVVFPVLFYFGGATEGVLDRFIGGLHWQSLAYSVWEQLVGFSMIIALLGIFRERLNKQGRLAMGMSSSAYAVYIFHTPILLMIGVVFMSWDIYPLLKFIVLAPVSLIVCYSIASQIRKIPLIRKIL